MNKSIFVIVALVHILFIFSCSNQQKTAAQRPNILWIVADDLGADLGCYDTPVVKTPHIDQLAREGARYTNCFTVCAVCSPSRSALVTGMYPTSINSHQHRTHFKKPLPDHVKVITHYFRKAGYFTCNGKYGDKKKPGKQDYNFIADSIYDGTDWSQRKPEQSFFAQIQIFGPHRAFQRDPANPVDANQVEIPPYYPDHPITRQDWALYLENIQIVDKQVGTILQRLEDEKLVENTIVFFFGDQGRPHVRAKQFLYDGGIRTPLILRWPGKIAPGTVVEELVSNVDFAPTVLQMININPPQYMQGQNFWGPEVLKREYIFAMRDRRDETVDRIRCVRNKQFKYIRNYYPERPFTQFNAYKKHQYPVLTLMQVLYKQDKLTPEQTRFMGSDRPGEEFYDLRVDPFELNNLAYDNDYKDIIEEMRVVLDKWLMETDKGTYPEDEEEVNYWISFAKKNFEKRMESRGLETSISDEDYLKYWEKYLTPTKPNENY
jgi:uncharacterized sulfatase